jgi:putative membrane protein
MTLLWLKALHLIAVALWFASLAALPQVFAVHAGATDPAAIAALRTLERRLHHAMNIGAVLALGAGIWVLASAGWEGYRHQGWFHAKLGLAALVVAFQGWCSVAYRGFRLGRASRAPAWYAGMGIVPLLLLAMIVVLVVVRPI